MASILAISSYVASGHVGLSAIVPALQAMGHDVIAVPTVVLSCHPGHPGFAAAPLPADHLAALLSSLARTNRLKNLDAIMTGYMPSAEHVQVTQQAIAPLVVDHYVGYLCDPIIGDWPKGLYVDADVACAIRDMLVPIADIATPNAFELSWLSGQMVTCADDANSAAAAFGGRRPRNIVATSVPAGHERIANVLLGFDESGAWEVSRREGVPHGTGDLFAGLLLGHLAGGGMVLSEAVGRATAGVRHIVDDSIGAQELRLVGNLSRAIDAAAA